jgi:hypothetical protein
MAHKKHRKTSRHSSPVEFKPLNFVPLQSLLILLLMGLLVALCWYPVRFGLADVFAYQARFQWQKWSQDPAQFTLENWLKARNDLRRAIWLDGKNPDHFEFMGRLYELKGGQGVRADEVADPFLSESVRYFEHALRLRPSSAMTWANLALSYYQLDQLGRPFIHALERAVFLGPWEPGVLDVVTDVGLGAWDQLTLPEQILVQENIKRQAQNRIGQLWLAAQVHAREELICTMSELNSALQNYCPATFMNKNQTIKETNENKPKFEALPPIELQFKGIID